MGLGSARVRRTSPSPVESRCCYPFGCGERADLTGLGSERKIEEVLGRITNDGGNVGMGGVGCCGVWDQPSGRARAEERNVPATGLSFRNAKSIYRVNTRLTLEHRC